MNGDKRNDIGLKVLLSTLALLVTGIITFSINLAGKADAKANINTTDIRGMKVGQEYIKESMQEIKANIKVIMRAVVK